MRKKHEGVKAYLERCPTTPIGNVVGHMEASIPLNMLRRDIRDAQGTGGLVDFHLERLGKHDFWFLGEFRKHVWDRPNYRVFISNFEGICFEVPVGATPEAAWAALREYTLSLKLPLNKAEPDR